MMYCLVRSLRSRRPSTTALLISPPWRYAAGVAGRSWSIVRIHTSQASSMVRPFLAHASPALEIGQRLEGDQGVAAHRLGERRQLRLVHQLQSPVDQLARQPDARPELLRIALVDVERPPHRQPRLAGAGPRLDLGVDLRCPVAVEIAQLGAGGAQREGMVGGGDAQRHQVGETLEHRAHRIARPLGDLRERGNLRAVAQQRQVGLDNQLARALAAQSAAIDDGSRGRHASAQAGVCGSRRSIAFTQTAQASSNDSP